jgi:hypothetical protein
MGIFSGVNEAKPSFGGNRLPVGDDHIVVIDKCLTQRSGRTGGDLFIVEFVVESSSTAKPGAKFSWVQDLTKRNEAFSALKGFVLALFKADQVANPEQYDQVYKSTETILEAAVSQNFLTGHRVGVKRDDVKTKAGHDFQKHTFFAAP